MNGLLLIGGKSSRMGSDKSELIFHNGLTQRQRGLELLECVCDRVFISTNDLQDTHENTIADAYGQIGPLGAIASAQHAHPGAAWLILACDLPLLEKKHLLELVDERDPTHDATYFTSAIDGLPEPLCAIWEPTSAPLVSAAVTAGERCPRSLLKKLNGHALPSPGQWILANINTEADAQEIRARLNNTTTVKTVTVCYFAQLRELTGIPHENLITNSETPAGLFEEIRAKHSIPIKRKGMMVAVNSDFTGWTYNLTDGDEVVFMPPVAGG